MTLIYDSTAYKPFEYNQGDDAVAFEALKLEQLDYQFLINFFEDKGNLLSGIISKVKMARFGVILYLNRKKFD